MSLKTERICPNGHRYLKSTDCPTCPICEEARKSEAGVFYALSAPARRALENNHIGTLEDLARHTEKDILKFHGMGKASIPALQKLLAEKGLSFKE